MFYGPHTLEIRRLTETRDEFNRTIGTSEWWEPIGPCRCDDNTTQKITDANGKAYIPKYHIVADRCDLKAGDYVRAVAGESVRGEGEIVKVINTNYLAYTSIYV